MASIFESYEDEIKQSFKQFDTIAAGFQHLPTDQKPAELEKLENLLSNIESNLSSLNLESNRTGKSTQQYFTQFYQAKRSFQQYKDKYQNEKNYADLIPSHHDFNTSASQSQRDRVSRGNKTLENGIQMIRMANDQVREDKVMAEKTLNELAVQKERLIGFEKKFDSIDGFLDKSKKLIAQMTRRAMANKFIMVGIILILLVAIILLVWLKFARHSSNTDSSHEISSSSHETLAPSSTPSSTPSLTPSSTPNPTTTPSTETPSTTTA
ncbi:hypothetical protein DICPUDRAFT_156528 [Dictyostelium purpureum]|uniref:Vesicle transport v-SNARE N-terminal domain-containing protein n=1 Tax=Dictyostelium purpureum TaxID=5786 RepID=F0ZWT4_DICPU|nr:uncharacterized protein DICPUDRAFT_156528 [Dictyostelium purpureum]EGC31594.1 hypothetical protein DICPUDRAFT_156528 [Dictyostelium purpureum]|eukprot:XP_003291878.1 hypothetical protein DICPUDRAFT_156528 [Dictyostelium purpureum]